MSAVTRVLIVDDHAVVRAGLRLLLGKYRWMKIIGEAGTVATAVTEASRLRPNVVLMDLRLPDGSGADACRAIREQHPDTKVIFLTSYAEEEAAMLTINAGADGFLLKETEEERLVDAIDKVVKGQFVLDPQMTACLVQRMRQSDSPSAAPRLLDLPPQQVKVLELVSKGLTNKEIANTLGLSDKTVRNYLSHIFHKLKISRRSEAAALYTDHKKR